MEIVPFIQTKNGTISNKAMNEVIIEKLRNEPNRKLVAEKLGIPYDRVAKWVAGKAKPKMEDYNLLAKYYGTNSINDGGELTVKKLKTDRTEDIQGVPFYDNVVATAGVIELLKRSPRHVPIDYIRVPDLPKCDGALRISGDSMYPLLKSGDMVLYRIVNDKANIIWGEMYLAAVVHNGDDFFCVKYLQQSKREGYVKFVSQNEHHQPVEFPIDSIVGLALVKASIRINSMF